MNCKIKTNRGKNGTSVVVWMKPITLQPLTDNLSLSVAGRFALKTKTLDYKLPFFPTPIMQFWKIKQHSKPNSHSFKFLSRFFNKKGKKEGTNKNKDKKKKICIFNVCFFNKLSFCKISCKKWWVLLKNMKPKKL